MARRDLRVLLPTYNEIYFLHTDSFSGEPLLLEDGERPENVLFDHVDDEIEVGDDHC